MSEKKLGGIYLLLAMLAFAGLGMEIVLGLGIEPLLFGAQVGQWTAIQNVIHWVVTCIIWVTVGLLLLNYAEQKLGLNLLEESEPMNVIQWGIVGALLIFKLAVSIMEWNGSKVLKEFIYNGLMKFIFQYAYYVVEVGMVCLIILFGQMAFERLIGGMNFPYGGLLLAITWGLAHSMTKGNIMAGFSGMLSAFIFGLVFLLTNRDLSKSYLIILIMFIL